MSLLSGLRRVLVFVLGVVFLNCPAWAGSISVPYDRVDKPVRKLNIIYVCSEFDDISESNIRIFLKNNLPKIHIPKIYVNSNRDSIGKLGNKSGYENLFIYFGSTGFVESLRKCVEGFPNLGFSYDGKIAEVGAVIGTKPPVFKKIPLGEYFAPLKFYGSDFKNDNNIVNIYMTSIKSIRRNGYMLMSAFLAGSTGCCKVNDDGTVIHLNHNYDDSLLNALIRYPGPMARLSRLAVPRGPHHVTQQGNRRGQAFFKDGDENPCKDLPGKAAGEAGWVRPD